MTLTSRGLLTFRGDYNASTNYIINDIIEHGANLWIAVREGCGNLPSSTSEFWRFVNIASSSTSANFTLEVTSGDVATIPRGSPVAHTGVGAQVARTSLNPSRYFHVIGIAIADIEESLPGQILAEGFFDMPSSFNIPAGSFIYVTDTGQFTTTPAVGRRWVGRSLETTETGVECYFNFLSLIYHDFPLVRQAKGTLIGTAYQQTSVTDTTSNQVVTPTINFTTSTDGNASFLIIEVKFNGGHYAIIDDRGTDIETAYVDMSITIDGTSFTTRSYEFCHSLIGYTTGASIPIVAEATLINIDGVTASPRRDLSIFVREIARD